MEHSVECKNENKLLIDAKIEIQYTWKISHNNDYQFF